MGEGRPTRISAPLVAALEECWGAIRRRHLDLPAVVVVVASGTEGSRSNARWGHFAALAWVQGEEQLAEVLVAGEGLRRGAEEVLTTLLHEAAHSLAQVRAVADTSRQGRYHNRRYAALAREAGLEVAEAGSFGWADTTMADATRHDYRRELARLTAALTLYRRGERTAKGAAKSTNLVAATCACGRRIRVAVSTLAAGAIVCQLCAGEFVAAVAAEAG